MIDFVNVGDTVEININSDQYFWSVPRILKVSASASDSYIYIDEDINAKSVPSKLRFLVTEINGRPSDDPIEVAQWLRDTYFNGIVPTSGSGGGSGGDASAANQLTMITELQEIEADVESVHEDVERIRYQQFDIPQHDEIELTYVTSGNGLGEVQNVIYKLSSSEVARLTLSYDSSDNLITTILS